MFLASKARLARIFKGLTQPELGKILNVSKQYIQQIEKGIIVAPKDTISKCYYRLKEDVD